MSISQNPELLELLTYKYIISIHIIKHHSQILNKLPSGSVGRWLYYRITRSTCKCK